eukprot:4153013-Pleurochrysis_carterae.AAC.1
MPRSSSECIMVAIVALVAVDTAFASIARMRSNSLPLPLQAWAYDRRAAVHEMDCAARGNRTCEVIADGNGSGVHDLS